MFLLRNAYFISIFFLTVAFSDESGAADLPATRWPLNQFLQKFTQASDFQSLQNELRAVDLDYASRDLGLAPRLEMEAKRTNELRETFSPVVKRRSVLLSSSLIKPFSTGTELELTPSLERATYATRGIQSTADWQVGITQKLWQDGFGRGTRLRRTREEAERFQKVAAILQKQAQWLNEIEGLFWDWVLALRERDLRVKNVERGRQMLSWVQDRYRRSAAESSDLLQAQALLTNRELQLTVVEQSLGNIATRAQRYLPGLTLLPDGEDLSRERPLDGLVTKWIAAEDERVEGTLKLELLQARYEAKAISARLNETKDSLRPELNVELVYGKNAIDPKSGTAWEDSYSQNHEYSSVGLVFRTGLDFSQESRKVASVRAQSEAAQQRLQSLENDGKIAWELLMQDAKDLQDRTRRARQLVDLQLKKANAERERYRLGRSTAFQAIQFEQEAADSEITLLNLLALSRKTEAKARLFAR